MTLQEVWDNGCTGPLGMPGYIPSYVVVLQGEVIKPAVTRTDGRGGFRLTLARARHDQGGIYANLPGDYPAHLFPACAVEPSSCTSALLRKYGFDPQLRASDIEFDCTPDDAATKCPTFATRRY